MTVGAVLGRVRGRWIKIRRERQVPDHRLGVSDFYFFCLTGEADIYDGFFWVTPFFLLLTSPFLGSRLVGSVRLSVIFPPRHPYRFPESPEDRGREGESNDSFVRDR